MKPFLYFILLLPLSLFGQNRYDVVIDEIMADPSPQVGLPNNEWIELKNVSAVPVNLQGWRIGDASGQSGPMPNYMLQPGSWVIVCTGSAVAAMTAFGPAISVTSFPSLDNDGDQLFLRAANGMIIHAVAYSASWYRNELKREGGWTLEMIDTQNPCAGMNNWKASTDPSGGTPGRKNAVDAVNPDNDGPTLTRTYTVDDLHIVAVFDEPVDSSSGSSVIHYTMNNGIAIIDAVPQAPLFHTVLISLDNPLQPQTVYTLSAAGISDCKGNTSTVAITVRAGLPQPLHAGDMVINEILFNPRSNASDYIELYNKSNKLFDASQLYVANRNTSNTISNFRQLSAVPWLIFPDDYIVVTTDLASLQREYLVKNPGWVFTVSSLPSLPDDRGFAILLNQQGEVVDEVNYDRSWHFKLIDNEDGVALERIDPDGASQEAGNWHSAASTAGYGTPTYKNSQYKLQESSTARIDITPRVFSPDNDGYNDIATIRYKMNETGYVANITIFDAAGRAVKNLVRNGTLGWEGYWNWDGLNDKGQKLPVGTYIVFTEIFNLQGKKQSFKNTLVLARRLN